MAVRVIDRATGETIEVSPQEARRAILQGEADAPSGRVLIRRGTETASLDSTELLGAWNQGWDLSDEEEHRQLKIRRDETDAASTAVGAIEAGVSGLTFGVSRLAEEALGVDPERMRARAEGLGAAEDIIEMGTGIGAAIATGGGGLLAKGGVAAGKAVGGRALARTAGRVAGAPVRGVMRGAEAVEAGVARAVGRTALPGVAKRALPVAGRGSVEGVAFGMGAEIDESVLEDRELSAEQLLAAGVMGAVFGSAGEVGVRVGLPGLARGTKKMAIDPMRKAVGRLTGAAKGSKAAADAVDATGRWYGKTTEILGHDPEKIARATQQAIRRPEDFLTASNQKAMARAHQDIAEEAYPRIDTMRSVHDRTRRITNGEARIERFRGRLPANADDIGGPTRRAVGQTHQKLTSKLDELTAANAVEDGARFDQGTINDVRRELEVALSDIVDDTSAVRAHRALQVARQKIGQEVRAMGGFQKGWEKNVLIAPDTKRTIRELRPLYDDLNTHLRDEAIYGELGKATAELDGATADYLRRLEAAKATGNRHAIRLLEAGAVMDPRDLVKLARSVKPGFRGETQVQEFWDIVESQRRYMDAAKKHADLTPDELAAIKDYDQAVKGLRGGLEKHSEIAAMSDDLGHIRDVEGASSVSIGEGTTLGPRVGAIGGAGIGLALGGPAGAALGGGLGMMLGSIATRPYTTLRGLAGVIAVTERVGMRTKEAVKRFASGKRAAKRAAKALGAGIKRGVTIGAARVGAKGDRKARYNDVRTYLGHTMANPDQLVARTERSMGNMPDYAPGLASLVQAKTGKAAQFLASKLPPAYIPPFTDPNDALVDPTAVDKFLRYVEVVNDPIVALDRLADGTITVEHAEALRAIYPAIYGDVQRQIVDQMAQDMATGKKWPHERRVRLGILFDAPTDAALHADSQLLIQAAHGPPPEEARTAPRSRGGRRAPDLSRGRGSGTERFEEPLSSRYA